MKFISHIHSTHSFDGKLDLRDLHELLRSHGVNVALMSEHIESLKLGDIQRFIEECRQVSTPDCVLIPGIEIDELNILIFGVRRVDEYDGVLDLAQQCHRRGALIAVSHPLKLRSELRPEIAEMVEAVEVWNQRYDGRIGPRWKSIDLLSRLRLSNPQIVPLSGLDFHSTSDFANIYMEVDGCQPSIEVLDAVRSGRHRIVNAGRTVEIPGAATASLRTIFRSKMATAARDGASFAHRQMKRIGLRVPNSIRIAFKKAL